MGKYGTIDISNFRKASDISFTAIEKAMATYLIYEDINNKGYIPENKLLLFQSTMIALGASCTLANFTSMAFYRYCKDKAEHDSTASVNPLQYLNFLFASLAEGLPVLGVGLKDGLGGKFYAGCVAAIYRMVKVGTVDVKIADENACPVPLSSIHPALRNFYEEGCLSDFFTASFPLLEGGLHFLATGLCVFNACKVYGIGVDVESDSNTHAMIIAAFAAFTLGLLGGAAETMLQTLYDMRKVKGLDYTRAVLSSSCRTFQCNGLMSVLTQLVSLGDKQLIHLTSCAGYNLTFFAKMLTQAMMYQTALFELMQNRFGYSDQCMFAICLIVTLTVGMKAGAGQFKSRLIVAEESWADSNEFHPTKPLLFSSRAMAYRSTPTPALENIYTAEGTSNASHHRQVVDHRDTFNSAYGAC